MSTLLNCITICLSRNQDTQSAPQSVRLRTAGTLLMSDFLVENFSPDCPVHSMSAPWYECTCVKKCRHCGTVIAGPVVLHSKDDCIHKLVELLVLTRRALEDRVTRCVGENPDVVAAECTALVAASDRRVCKR